MTQVDYSHDKRLCSYHTKMQRVKQTTKNDILNMASRKTTDKRLINELINSPKRQYQCYMENLN